MVDCFAGTNVVKDVDAEGDERFLRGFKITADLNKIADLRAQTFMQPTEPAAPTP